MRGIDMISTHWSNLAEAPFDPKVILEDLNIATADREQRIHGFVRNIVAEIARGNGRQESSKLEIFRLPIVYQGFEDLPKQIVLSSKDPIELVIGGFTQACAVVTQVGRQFLSRECEPLALHSEGKRKAIGDDVVELIDRAAAGDVLNIDNLFFWFTQGMGLVPANRFQMVSDRTRSRHEPPRVVLIHTLPPEIEIEQTVAQDGQPFLHLRSK